MIFETLTPVGRYPYKELDSEIDDLVCGQNLLMELDVAREFGILARIRRHLALAVIDLYEAGILLHNLLHLPVLLLLVIRVIVSYLLIVHHQELEQLLSLVFEVSLRCRQRVELTGSLLEVGASNAIYFPLDFLSVVIDHF